MGKLDKEIKDQIKESDEYVPNSNFKNLFEESGLVSELLVKDALMDNPQIQVHYLALFVQQEHFLTMKLRIAKNVEQELILRKEHLNAFIVLMELILILVELVYVPFAHQELNLIKDHLVLNVLKEPTQEIQDHLNALNVQKIHILIMRVQPLALNV